MTTPRPRKTAASKPAAEQQYPGIPSTLAHLAVPVEALVPYPGNPRRGDVDSIKESLEVNGQYRPIVVNRRNGEVLAGNHTLEAAKGLGWTHIAATYVDADEQQAAKIVLVDNKTNDLAGYDTEALARILSEMPELTGTGYDIYDLEKILDTAGIEAPIQLESGLEKGGEMVPMEHLTWGFLQYRSTRVQTTAPEVDALDAVYEAFKKERNTDAGFVWWLLEQAHDTATQHASATAAMPDFAQEAE